MELFAFIFLALIVVLALLAAFDLFIRVPYLTFRREKSPAAPDERKHDSAGVDAPGE